MKEQVLSKLAIISSVSNSLSHKNIAKASKLYRKIVYGRTEFPC